MSRNFRTNKSARQQDGGGIIIWAGIVGDELIGPFLLTNGVLNTSASYFQLLESNFLPLLDGVTLQKRKPFVFLHDNAPAHSAKATQHFLA